MQNPFQIRWGLVEFMVPVTSCVVYRLFATIVMRSAPYNVTIACRHFCGLILYSFVTWLSQQQLSSFLWVVFVQAGCTLLCSWSHNYIGLFNSSSYGVNKDLMTPIKHMAPMST